MSEQPLTSKQKTWLAHLQRCEAQGMSLTAYGDANGLSAQQLYQWRYTLRQKGQLPARSNEKKKTPWVTVIPKAQGTERCLLRFPNGMELEWDQGYAIDWILQLVDGVCGR